MKRMEKRKDSEINELNNYNKNLELQYENLKSKNKITEDTNLKLEIQNSKLKYENGALRSERDRLSTIIEDMRQKLEQNEEERKKVDDLKESYRSKLNEIDLERKSFNSKLELYERKLNEKAEEYKILIKEQINKYESLDEENKEKYNEEINKKDNEINAIQAKLFEMKIERDKYMENSQTNQQLIDEAEKNYNQKINEYSSLYEKAKIELETNEKSRNEEIQMLKERYIQLENENTSLKNDLAILKHDLKDRNKQIEDLENYKYNTQKDLNRMREYKENNDFEKVKIKNDNAKLITLYDSKIKNLTEEYENKIYYLEDIKDKQAKKLSLMESKALEMIKSQQLLTEKYKKELINTINYYEGLINNQSSGKEGNINNNIIVKSPEVV
jgi:kinetochore protein NDC80